MRVLALEPYLGGSHQAFLEGWSKRSQHAFTLLSLPARKWKWRMRGAAITFADEVRQRLEDGQSWDALFASDMLNLAEFLGLLPALANLPSVIYFHENQLTYPQRHADERDHHFGLINLTSALAAQACWFNSDYHRQSFLAGVEDLLDRMPDHRPARMSERVLGSSRIVPQGIDDFPERPRARPGPLRILWAARWEHDKNPEAFFAALTLLKRRGVTFRLSVLGQQFRAAPAIFEQARVEFAAQLDHFGHLPERRDYRDALLSCHVVVSSAQHEFFGVSVAEAVAAGAWPLVPRSLAYPELLGGTAAPEGFFHDGQPASMANALEQLARRQLRGDLWQGDPNLGRRQVARFSWRRLAPELDRLLELLVRPGT